MKRYAFLYTIIMYTALSHAMVGERPNPARDIMAAKPFAERVTHVLTKLMPPGRLKTEAARKGAVIMARAAIALCNEGENAWLNYQERTQQEKDWYVESKAAIEAFVQKNTPVQSVIEEGAAARNDLISRIMATEAARQAMGRSQTEAQRTQSSSLGAVQAGFTLSLTELLQALSEARQQLDALQQERSDSATALEELENRMAALIEDQRQLGTVSAKSPQLAGSLSILIASLASDAENASAEAKTRKKALLDVQRRQQELAAQMSDTVSAANMQYNTTAAQRSDLERQLQEHAFETAKLRRKFEESNRILERLSEARELAASFAHAGALTQKFAQTTAD